MYKNITFLEFQNMFATEKKCEEYLFNKRWKNGFVCPKCGYNKYYSLPKKKLYQCKNCGYQTSLTANTIFHKTRTPLQKWFLGIYLMTNRENGIPIIQFKEQLSIKSYQTAWSMYHKIEKAFDKRNPNNLKHDFIELNELYFGHKK